MKILLGIATYPTEPHIYAATQEAIDALQHGDHEVHVGQYGSHDPKLSAKDDLTAKHNRMRLDAIDGNYDALFLVEADMLIPPDALTKLAAQDADIAYGLYCSRHSGMWLCFPQIDGHKGTAINADPEQAKAAWGKVVPSEGAGFGCTLIHRRVLEQIEFRSDKRRKFDDDWQFALDAKEAGFRSVHDMSVVCGHLIHDGRVMFPDPDAPQLHRIDGEQVPQHNGVALPDVGTYRCRKVIFGSERTYYPGEEIELSAEAAAVLLGMRGVETIQEAT